MDAGDPRAPSHALGLRANWWGIAGERVHRLVGRLSSSEIISGIRARTDHHGVPYAITEEFVAVYRMHPLMPDDLFFHSLATVTARSSARSPSCATGRPCRAAGVRHGRQPLLLRHRPPGAIRLHNYPRSLQEFVDGRTGLSRTWPPRTSCGSASGACRATTSSASCFHRRPATAFEQLTDNPELARGSGEVYENELDRVDLTVGMYAEPCPAGFGFSDTAFRVFILMASRRLNSDRFFTGLHAGVYTPAGHGLDRRHRYGERAPASLPELAPPLRGVTNAFAPWARVD